MNPGGANQAGEGSGQPGAEGANTNGSGQPGRQQTAGGGSGAGAPGSTGRTGKKKNRLVQGMRNVVSAQGGKGK